MLLDVAKLPREGESFDVVVIGAGGAGMSAALFAAIEGARVLLVERTEYVGGTTAWSAGTTCAHRSWRRWSATARAAGSPC